MLPALMTKIVAQILSLLMFSSLAFANDVWTSAGGEGVREARNPWFLNNVREVSYCVEIDSANFGVTAETAQAKVKKALAFWQTEFSKASLPSLPTFGALKIASQNFVEKSCDETTDLRFQFGVLSADQETRLKNPQEFAALSVRTQYSVKDLKAQGFVYVSPTGGRLAYRADGFLQDLWSRDQSEALYLTLVHELGHVFGLPHLGSYGELMSEGYVESLITQGLMREDGKALNQRSLNFFSLVKSSPTICPDPALLKEWQKVFNLGDKDRCVQFKFEHDPMSEFFGSTKIQVWASSGISAAKALISQADLAVGRFTPTYLSLIWLPIEQEVFDKIELQNADLGVIGTPLMSITKRGSFTSVDGQSKHNISVRFDQGSSAFYIDGVNSLGEIITLL
jgi:hypothetical protein